jgi:hypothetical protein
MSGRAVWVLSPTDGKAHLLAVEGANCAPLTTQCGRSLPFGVLQHDRLPSRQLCRDCFAAYLLPAPVFARMTPAGRRLNAPESAPGGQPVPDPADCAAGLPDNGHHVADYLPGAPVPRWVQCPVDPQLHLLSPGEVAAAGGEGYGRAACGRLISAEGLTLVGPSAGMCVSCLAVGTAR